jgi:DNA sulfur modification protein DndB
MSEFLGPLITEQDEITATLRKRKKKVIEDTIKAKNLDLLDEKLAVEEKDGWRLLRKNKASYRIARDKPHNEQLEDEVWCILAQMQFKEMSDGRHFKIQTNKETEPRQIDVFAKDDETAIYVECTQKDEPGGKRMAPLIEKIISIQDKVTKSLHAHYGKTPKLKQGWVIATRNIGWSDADLEKAKAAKITVLRDTELDYYVKFMRLYKLAAKYQLLAHLFANEKILGLELVVPATKGNMGGVDFYNFLIKPVDLLKISHVSHKASRDIQDINTYQRMLNPKRLVNIAQYIDNGGQFPTNIVVNVRTKKNKKLRFEKIDNIGDSAFGRLHLPNQYASVMVIDGQHRLYGYAHSERIINGKEGKATVPVLAYENLEPTKEARLFVDINCEQVKVPRNLLHEIYATLYWDSDDFELQLEALCSKILMVLNANPSSPIYDRVKMTSKDQTYLRCLTPANFVGALKENKFFGEEKKTGFVPGPLTDSSSDDLKKTMKKAVGVIDGYLGFFAKTIRYHWDLGNTKKEKEGLIGYLATNEGVRALFRVLKSLLVHIQQEDGVDIDRLDSEDLIPKLEKYCKPIADVFETPTYDTVAMFRSRSGQKGVRQNMMFMQNFINKQYPEFNPPGLAEYLDTIDVEGTKEAKELIGDLLIQMQKFVLHKLKERYPGKNPAGKPNWWFDGVPLAVRKACMERYEAEKGVKEPEQYIDIIDFHTIATRHWKGFFDELFTFEKDGGKDKKLQWIQRLNAIRNITHHETKWPASKEEVAFIRDIYKKGMGRFVIPE